MNAVRDGRAPARRPTMQFANVVPGVPSYEHNSTPSVTHPGGVQRLNPNVFVSILDPSTGACLGDEGPQNCQVGNLDRNALRGPEFAWSDFYRSKWIPPTGRWRLRLDVQFFNLCNRPDFGLPSIMMAGIPGTPSAQTKFCALTCTTSLLTGLQVVGLGGDRTPRMFVVQGRLEF